MRCPIKQTCPKVHQVFEINLLIGCSVRLSRVTEIKSLVSIQHILSTKWHINVFARLTIAHPCSPCSARVGSGYTDASTYFICLWHAPPIPTVIGVSFYTPSPASEWEKKVPHLGMLQQWLNKTTFKIRQTKCGPCLVERNESNGMTGEQKNLYQQQK